MEAAHRTNDQSARTSRSSPSIQPSSGSMSQPVTGKRPLVAFLENDGKVKLPDSKKPAYVRREPKQFFILPLFSYSMMRAASFCSIGWKIRSSIYLKYITSPLLKIRGMRGTVFIIRGSTVLSNSASYSGRLLMRKIKHERYFSKRIEQSASMRWIFPKTKKETRAMNNDGDRRMQTVEKLYEEGL